MPGPRRARRSRGGPARLHGFTPGGLQFDCPSCRRPESLTGAVENRGMACDVHWLRLFRSG